MEEKTYILFTSGRGPLECALAVHGIQKKFKKFCEQKSIPCRIINQKKGSICSSMESIVFELTISDASIFDSWKGSLLWICKSPVRKFHKRRNWFVKCVQIFPSNQEVLKKSDVIVQSYRASGPGGQHRNKVETAVRLIHKKSGLIVTAADGKSQLQNRKKAWINLLAKFQELNNSRLEADNSEKWSNQIEVIRGKPIRTFRGKEFD